MVQVQEGDVLALNTTYETKLASWYESMGISVVYMAPGDGGRNPYRTKVDWPGEVTHGHLPENNVHGGSRRHDARPGRRWPAARSPAATSSSTPSPTAWATSACPGMQGRPPRVRRGRSLTFELSNGDASQEIWHSITSCAPPCNRNTGIAYPIPDGEHQFDSGQLGDVVPAVYRRTWETPKDLPVGTYTYFCRIHPMMRGAFRVVKPVAGADGRVASAGGSCQREEPVPCATGIAQVTEHFPRHPPERRHSPDAAPRSACSELNVRVQLPA